MVKSKIDDTERYLTAGSKVEVRMKQTCFRGTRYIATIITPPSLSPPNFQNPNENARLIYKKFATVEYENLMEEDGVSKLRETVDVAQIRPILPMERRGLVEFKIGDSVDCLMKNGGWCDGMIVKVLVEEKVFGVSFSYIKRILNFNAEDLRIHREWIHGDWVPPFCSLRLRNRLLDSEAIKAEHSKISEEYVCKSSRYHPRRQL